MDPWAPPEPPPHEWKNGALASALYEAAFERASVLSSMFPEELRPATWRQRLRWRIADYRRRISRAARILAGRDDEDC